MDRRVKVAIGVVAVVVLLAVAYLIGRSSGGDDEVATGPTTSTSVVGTTSTGVATTVPFETTVAPDTTPSPDTTPAPGTVLTTDGALLEAAPQPTVQSTDGPDSPCGMLGDDGWTVDKCDRVEMAGGTRVWLTEYRPSGAFKEWRAFVLHWSQGKGAWLTDLRYTGGDQTPGMAQVNVRPVDLTGDGKPELVFGFHGVGSGSYLFYDIVVDGPGSLAAVGASRGLSHGRAKVVAGSITDYEAKYPNGEPNCCPAFIQVSKVTYTNGEFRVVETGQDGPGEGPPADASDL